MITIYTVTICCHTHCTAHSYYFNNNKLAANAVLELQDTVAFLRETGLVNSNDYHEIEIRYTISEVSKDCAANMVGTKEEIPYLA
jgi:hypothetical protein